MCLLTDLRCHSTYTETVARSFASAGLPAFVRSEAFGDLTETVAKAVQAIVDESSVDSLLPNVVNTAIYDVANDKLFQSVAMNYREIVLGVVDSLPNVNRSTGQILWIDGPDALVSLEHGESGEEETRIVASDYLAGMGIDTDGQPLIAIDQQWSPDAERISYYQPAVVVSHWEKSELALLERLLRDAELPPPRGR